ncbi:Uma2 family endonuclease [Streptomyces sp. NPDC057099]|uniref:Uma2 family endonuclease n=1 Tax=Streptomyces sp. NPDC057099 TaxID=3346019 RepID=UPI003637DBD2
MSVLHGDCLLTGNEWDELVWIREQTRAPKGCKVEIIEGIITVTPHSTIPHHRIADRVHRSLSQVIPEHWHIFQGLGMAVPARLGLYVPDLAVVPELPAEGHDDVVPAAVAQLAVEITSAATAHHDRTVKAAGYAEAGVPLYLLVDGVAPGGPTVTLYGEPRKGVYRLLRAGRFGERITLPDPIGLELDTGEFPDN